MTTYNLQNPYSNVESYPAQPFQSVVDTPLLYETAGLNPYNFVNFGPKYNQHRETQKTHREAFPPNRLPEMSYDTTNVLPYLTPLYYRGVAQNYNILNNPFPVNENYDLRSEKTNIQPYLNVTEEYPTVSPVMVGFHNSKLTLGTASFN